MKKYELLAPVGSWEALEAAVQNGADAVYLGGKAFNARQSAANFNDEEIKKAIDYCHIRGVQLFVTVNTLIRDEEFIELGKYLTFLYNQDVDAVIVQDLGVAKFIRDFLPNFELHASTQMSVHNLEGVQLLQSLGFKRVVLAREMTLEEIHQIRLNTSVDLEVFVHGALCISYSGQCLMSSMIGGRSGNRGRCAQPCRMTYSLVNQKNQQVVKTNLGSYLLSPRDLNTSEQIHQILDAGVKSLKVEGRMKRPEYVATIVGAYRKAIDHYCRNQQALQLGLELKEDMEQIFNRKFTQGYLFDQRGHDLMSFEKPSNRGILLGEALSYDKGKKRLKLRLIRNLEKGDGVEVWINNGDNPGALIEAIYKDDKKLDKGFAGDLIEIPFRAPIQGKAPVYKTTDQSLLKRARESYERRDKEISLYGHLKGTIGHPLSLSLWDSEDHYAHQASTSIVEKAIKTATGEARIREQVAKLGSTPYKLKDLTLEIDQEAAIPIGEINKLRREVVEKIDGLRANRYQRKCIEVREQEIEGWLMGEPAKIDKKLALRVSVNSLEQLESLIGQAIQRVYYRDLQTFEKATEMLKDKKIEIVPAFPRITRDKEMPFVHHFMERGYREQKIMISNLGVLQAAKDTQYECLCGDYFLNVFNRGAIKQLKELGVDEVCLSPELTLKQLEKIMKNGLLPAEVVVHGHLMLMVMEYCPIKALVNPSHKKGKCDLCRNNQFGLKDRLGKVFPILTDESCRTHLLNTQKLCMIGHMSELVEAGLNNFRIDFTIESHQEIQETLEAYGEVIENLMSNKKQLGYKSEAFLKKMQDKGLTKGHFFRGVE
ncbi:MAG: U32 family peptidase [Thermotaleaceae bacterium]